MVLNHDHKRALIDGQLSLCYPATDRTEGITKAQWCPQLAAAREQEMPQRLHGFRRCIGHGGDGGSGGDDAVVIVRSKRRVAVFTVTGSQSPAISAITGKATRILQAMGAVDQRMRPVLFKVIGIAVRKTARIKAEKRVVRKKQRPAQRRPQRQCNAVVTLAIHKMRTRRPAAMIVLRRHCMGG